jgi:Sec-independent protein secretion pathway component TatC
MAPLVLLFEFSVILARIFERRRERQAQAEWDDDDDPALS